MDATSFIFIIRRLLIIIIIVSIATRIIVVIRLRIRIDGILHRSQDKVLLERGRFRCLEE